MNIGDLYCYPATLRLELFEDPSTDYLIIDYLGLIEPEHPFVLLNFLSLEEVFWRLYVLTTDGRVGWVTIHFVQLLKELNA